MDAHGLDRWGKKESGTEKEKQDEIKKKKIKNLELDEASKEILILLL